MCQNEFNLIVLGPASDIDPGLNEILSFDFRQQRDLKDLLGEIQNIKKAGKGTKVGVIIQPNPQSLLFNPRSTYKPPPI